MRTMSMYARFFLSNVLLTKYALPCRLGTYEMARSVSLAPPGRDQERGSLMVKGQYIRCRRCGRFVPVSYLFHRVRLCALCDSIALAEVMADAA